MSQISEIMPEMDMRYDSQGNAVSKLTGKITNLNEEYQKYNARKLLTYLTKRMRTETICTMS